MSIGDLHPFQLQHAALGFTVDRWWPFTHRVIGQDQPIGKPEAKRRWEWMRREGIQSCSRIWKPLLTKSQYNSLRILVEWWDDDIQPRKLGQKARDIIAVVCREEPSQSLDRKVELNGADLRRSKYHEELYRLFFFEFLPEHSTSWYSGAYINLICPPLELQRSCAIEYAATQRIASAVVEDLLTTSLSTGPNDSRRRNTPSESLPALLSMSTSATLNPCPWLKTCRTPFGRPFYLWDVKARRTIETAGLRDLQYICISHTWGRYRKNEEGATIPGTLWPIPRNTIVDVEDLPTQFAKAFGQGFVWFDLFCIPQDRSKLALKEIARQGIIFQNAKSVIAWINDVHEWTSLCNKIEWLASLYLHKNVDTDYCYGPKVSAWLRCQCFSVPSIATSSGDSLFGLRTAELHPWLTSLWTLQEVCLRPDMALCSRHWEALLAGSSAVVTLDALIVLCDSVARMTGREDSGSTMAGLEPDHEWIIDPPPTYSGQHTAVKEAIRKFDSEETPDISTLLNNIEEAFLPKVRSTTASGVISIGQRRQVSAKGPTRRAEAIMSAVGATSWFDTLTRLPEINDTDLLFGIYPLSFIHEIARQQPFEFYGGIDYGLAYLGGLFGLEPHGGKALRPVGSMMPFRLCGTVANHSYDAANLSIYGDVAHASTQDWTIGTDGSVLIKRVAYLVPVQGPLEDLPGTDWIAAPDPALGTELGPDTPIRTWCGQSVRAWLHTCLRGPRFYAVCLAEPNICGPTNVMSVNGEISPLNRLCCGVLLAKIGVRGHDIQLVKVGSFVVTIDQDFHLIEEDAVWHVL